MQAWLLSIVGIISLGLLLEIVMPEGQTSKYVRGAFSLLVVFVIASPLPSLLKGELPLTLDRAEICVDTDFLESTRYRSAQYAESEIEEYLQDKGYPCRIDLSYVGRKVVKIMAKIEKSVLETNDANTYIQAVTALLQEIAIAEDVQIVVEVDNCE